jgi:hypothetical protein
MSKKPSKGSRPPKSTPLASEPAASKPVEPPATASRPAPRQTGASVAPSLSLVRRWLPFAGIIISIILGFTNGIAVAVLGLAATAMLTAVAAIWASLQVLAGDRADELDGAMQMITSGGESEQKAFLLRALKDLEFERSLGKISEQDYEELKQRYRARAKEVLQELDKRNESARAEAERMASDWLSSRGFAQIDGETTRQATKAAETLPANQPEHPAAPADNQGDRRTCASCGTDNEGDARFCKKCGAAMEGNDVDEAAAARSEEA